LPVRGRREGLPPETTTEATRWIAAGAAVGGCCRVRPSDIAAITDIAHTAARPG
jgi:S-methylmethionine-dependent homocysteine/selenocysteine methylase